MYDSYGDGWNGSTVTITTSADGSDIILLTGTLDDGSEGTLYFGLNYEGDCGPVYGCMDINALNFNPAAVQDDGSCQYPISGCTDSDALNFNVDAEIDDSSCYYDYDVLGCTDVTADNYNAEATYDDGSCQSSACPDGYVLDCDGSGECHPAFWIGDNYADCEDQIWGADLSCYDNDGGDCGDVAPDGLGCTDPTALNFDSEAIEDDGSCQYPIDCSGFTAVSIDVGGGTWQDEVSWIIGGFSGSVGSTDACLEDGCLTFTMLDSYGDGWNGNIVTITSETGDVLLTGTLDTGSEGTLSFGLNFDGDCGPVYGCTDDTATNYNPDATEDDDSCQYPLAGCTDDTATNYNPDASDDDGSCVYPVDCQGLNSVTVNVSDSGPGGEWNNEVSWVLGDSLALGGVGTTSVCLEDGCYWFYMFDSWGDGWNGSDVTITSESGDVILTGTLEGGDSGILEFALNTDCGDGPINGCTDPNALNFDPNANSDDGSCEYNQSDLLDCQGQDYSGYEYYLGDGFCDDGTWGLYFNCEQFNFDNGDCDIVIDYGACTDPNALNFDPNATLDDGSCEYDNSCVCPEIYEPVCGANGITYSNSCFAGCDGVTYFEGECDDEPVDCSGIEASVNLSTSDWAVEISWDLFDSNQNLVAAMIRLSGLFEVLSKCLFRRR